MIYQYQFLSMNFMSKFSNSPSKIICWCSFYTLASNVNQEANNLNNDLIKISKWTLQWKIYFNLNPQKQGLEVIFFSRKVTRINHPPLFFNHNLVNSTSSWKQVGMVLDAKFDFKTHLSNVCNKINKTIVMNIAAT